jgi:hypothetical protein
LKGLDLLWLGIPALNAVWLVLIPSRSGKAIGLLGILISATILALTRGKRNNRTTSPTLLLPFVLPVVSFAFTPRVAFLLLDGRVWLIVAWISVALLLLFKKPRPESISRPPTALAVTLFIVWSSLLWITAIWDLGVGRYTLATDRVSNGSACQLDPLAVIISTWESSPPSEHLFLGWRTTDGLTTRTVYASHVHPYLLSMYAWIGAVRALTGSPLFVASNTTPLFYLSVVVVALAILLRRTGLLERCSTPIGALALFLAIGSVITTWRFWSDLFRYNTDNPYPLLAGVLIYVYSFLLPPARPRLALASAVIFVALSPIHAPMLILAVFCIFATRGTDLGDFVRRNRLITQICLWSLVAGLVAIGLPRLLIAWKGYTPLASSFVFRSGLDGDSTYFTNIFRAFWVACPGNCCYPRPPVDLLMPSVGPALAFVPLVALNSRGDARFRPIEMLMFLVTPYLVSLILFPQSVAIHPYLYDHLLLIPIVVVGAAALLGDGVRERLRGTFLLGVILFKGWVIMSNLIAIARAVNGLR